MHKVYVTSWYKPRKKVRNLKYESYTVQSKICSPSANLCKISAVLNVNKPFLHKTNGYSLHQQPKYFAMHYKLGSSCFP